MLGRRHGRVLTVLVNIELGGAVHVDVGGYGDDSVSPLKRKDGGLRWGRPFVINNRSRTTLVRALHQIGDPKVRSLAIGFWANYARHVVHHSKKWQ